MLTLAEHYRKMRKDHSGITASTAYDWAQRTQKTPERDYAGDDMIDATVKVTRGKFCIHLTACIDECPDHSYIGKYSSTWEEGAIRNPESIYDRGVYEWWIPCTTEAEHYKSLRDMKCGKTESRELAHSYVRDAMKMMQDMQSYVVTVTAYVNGIELGSDSLGGVDVSDDYDYLANCVDEHGMIENAIEQAEQALKGLCETAQHEWQIGRFTGAKTCAKCGLLPLDQDDTESPCPGKVASND